MERAIQMFAAVGAMLFAASASAQGDGEWDVVADGDGEWDVVEDEPAASTTPSRAEQVEDDLGVTLHGSLENQLTGLWPKSYSGNERLYAYDSVKMRVDLDADLPEGITLRSDAVARIFVGETEFDLVNLIPKRTFDELVERDPRWANMSGEKYALENELYLDNAYMIVPVSGLVITVGKQPLEQGAGYAWNPTDVFTDKDIFDPSYEKEGVVALRLMLPINEFASLDLIGAPDGKLERWGYGGRLSMRAGPLSLSAASYVTRVERTQMEESMDAMELAALAGLDPMEAVIRSDSQRIMVGGDAILDVGGVRLWAEGAYNLIEDEVDAPDDWWEITSGLEYFFPFETHVMAEYHHYGAGPQQRGGVYDYNAWMQVLAAEVNMLGRDFLFESIDHPVADFWTLGFSSFQSLSDSSVALMADVRWEFVQDAELWLLLSGAIGEDEDFLSSARGQGWLRLTVHF